MEEWRQAKRVFSRAGLGYLAFLLMGFLLQIEASLMIQLLRAKGIEVPLESWGMIAAMLPMYLVGGPVCYLIMKDIPVVVKPERRSMGFGQLIILFFICISVMYIGNIMGLGLMSVVNGIQGKPLLNPLSEVMDSMNIGVIVLLLVIAAPVVEELLYRKLLIDRVGQFGDKTAILMSGFLFGISHGNFYQFFYAFGLGVIFAYIYIRTGKIQYTITFHAIINFMGSVVALQVGTNLLLALFYGMFMLLSVIAGIVLLVLFKNKAVIRPGYAQIPKEQRFSVCFGSVGMILFFLSSVVSFVLFQVLQ